ncbi:DUF6090 family protein [Luteirhabdus pelagi]|uniref:DUF6090 family protein n=1 Tax=Luteirhabdus pelagi TaxID=2792783 RepID=UPI00193A448A|nr:DUF6090 family protein [Luteirhabdus pelagi]
MIKFFRKIRYDLLSKGQTGNYLKYAIGEILLVVIGILIALKINNWNQVNKDDEILREYLGKIKSHTQEDMRMLDSLTMYRKNIGDLCKKARIAILDKKEEENLLLFMGCGSAFMDFHFKPNTGGYEALKNSSYFGKINNTNLDSLLIRYHRLVDDISQNEGSYNGCLKGQENYLSTQFDKSLVLATAFLPPDSLNVRATPQSEYMEDFKVYTSSASYRNVINLAAFQFDWMIDLYGQLNEVGENVIKEIDSYEN